VPLENLQAVGNYFTSAVHGECYSPQPDHEGQTVMVVTQKFFRVDWNAGGKGLAHQYVIS